MQQYIYCVIKFLFTGVFLLITTTSFFAQQWSVDFDDQAESAFIDMVEVENGNTYALVNGSSRLLTILDENGSVISNVELDSEFDNVYCLFYKNNAIYIGGDRKEDFRIYAKFAKFDLNGSKEWDQTYERGSISAISSYSDGFLLGGKGSDTNARNSFVVRVDADGNLQWANFYDFYADNRVRELLVDDNRVFAVIRASNVGIAFDGIVVVELDPLNGVIIWRQDYRLGLTFYLFNSGFDSPLGAILSDDDIIIVAPGTIYGNFSTLFKINKDGQNIRTKRLYNNYGTIPSDIALTKDDEIFIVGNYETDIYSACVEKRDLEGNLLWRQHVKDGSFFRVSVSDDYILASGCAPNYIENRDFHPYIMKMSVEGDLNDSGAEISLKIDELGMCDDSSVAILNDEKIVVDIEGKKYYINDDGKYVVNKPPGVYDVEFELPPTFGICQSEYQVVINENETTEEEFVLNRVDTVFLAVGMTKTELLRSEVQTVFIEYSNMGNIESENTFITLTKDERIEVIGTSHPFTINNEGQYIFDVETLNGFQSGKIAVEVKAAPSVLESTYLDMNVSIQSPAMQSMLPYEYIEVYASCVNDEVNFEISNKHDTETAELDLELFLDGYRDKRNTVSVSPNSKVDLKHISEGHAVTLRILQNEKLIKSVSYEGCDHFENNLYSVNVAPQMYHLESTITSDRVPYKVVDQLSGSLILTDNLGLSSYHLLEPNTETVGFNLRFTNRSDSVVSNLKATVDLFHERGNSPINFRAASHQFETFLIDDQLQISVVDTILPNEEFHLKMNIPIAEFDGESKFLSSLLSWYDGNSKLGIESEGYHNLTDYIELESSEISPHTSISNGQMLGKSGAIDFIEKLLILPDGSKIVVMASRYSHFYKQLELYKIDHNEKAMWHKVFLFEEGQARVNDIQLLDDGNIVLLGGIDDKKIYSNLNEDSYSFYKVISQAGDEVLEKVWKQGEGLYQGSLLTSILRLDNGHLALFGHRHSGIGRSFFRMVVDQDFNELSFETIQLPIGNIEYPIASTRSYGDYVVHSFLYFSWANLPSSFVIYSKDGTIYRSPDIELEYPNGDPFRNEPYFLENGNMILSGSYTNDISETESEQRHVIMECNIFGNPLEIIEVMPEVFSFTLESIAPKGDNYLVVGTWQADSLSNQDILFLEVDHSGEILWMEGQDLGAREYDGGSIISEQGRDYCTFQTQAIDRMYNLQGGYIFRDWDSVATDQISNLYKEVSIYPNPTIDRLHIESEIGIKKCTIISSHGVLIRSIHLPSRSIDVMDVGPGNYFLMLTLDNGNIEVASFTKM